MATETSPLNGKQVRYDDIKHFPTKEEAQTAIAQQKTTLNLRPQSVGASKTWIIEGHYKSEPYGNPYVLRTDGVFRKLHTDKPATR